jgi:hypothetical protein
MNKIIYNNLESVKNIAENLKQHSSEIDAILRESNNWDGTLYMTGDGKRIYNKATCVRVGQFLDIKNKKHLQAFYNSLDQDFVNKNSKLFSFCFIMALYHLIEIYDNGCREDLLAYPIQNLTVTDIHNILTKFGQGTCDINHDVCHLIKKVFGKNSKNILNAIDGGVPFSEIEKFMNEFGSFVYDNFKFIIMSAAIYYYQYGFVSSNIDNQIRELAFSDIIGIIVTEFIMNQFEEAEPTLPDGIRVIFGSCGNHVLNLFNETAELN